MEGLPPDTPILVVDDSPAIRTVVERWLRQLGYRSVRTAGDVAGALATFREQESEVVFLDMVLEGRESGLDFAERALAERPFTDVVVMSALDRRDDLVRDVVSQGARYVLSKPVRPSDLRAVLAAIADEREDAKGTSELDATYV